MAPETLYVTDSGRYLTGWQLRQRIECGEWCRRIVDESTGVILVESADETVIALTILAMGSLPSYLEVRGDGHRTWVADRRRVVPSSQSADVVGPIGPQRQTPVSLHTR
ncbi:hypothetical protein [Halovivax cerinus]|uniref:Uncharacterized protein n=1 Tax=Halovivax cerinus TaxID=1487865 RepID=A0ABD5NMW5_9EURY|nr:hypothetical protein [Halovivax cerinus]